MSDSIPVTVLKGVGPNIAQRLSRLGIETVQDLLFHLPIRYQDRTRVTPMGTARPGNEVVIQGTVQTTEIRFGKRRSLICRISDGTGVISLRFFHFSATQKANLAQGTVIRCFGEIRRGPNNLEIVHPEYRVLDENAISEVEEFLTPVYPATEGLQQNTLRTLTDRALQYLTENEVLRECLPNEFTKTFNVHLREALFFLHRPTPDVSCSQLEEGCHPAQQRLAFEELLAHHLCLRRLRNKARHQTARQIITNSTLTRRFLSVLPFTLTKAQAKTIREIEKDLCMNHPMQRLVQGDVGSGKTVVAFYAALCAVESGNQAAVMAPTELLAEQHLKNFTRWTESLGINITWLSGKLTRAARVNALKQISEGWADIVVGTHALFQQDVEFNNLALVIIDEQHRFGVHQRMALRDKGLKSGYHPHQLILTATPIPRTLTMTFYADLDCSIIDELPPGRTPVETVVIQETRRDEVISRVRAACREGRQAYWVCPLIEESDMLQCQAAQETESMLKAILPEISIGLIHGRMKSGEKEETITAFKDGKLDLLVATTVIEVGVDVPNASLMIIENSERLGLAQLHQLRGRVGRGAVSSCCVLMYRAPISRVAHTRLATLRSTNDGFEIAQKDLEIRGPGEVLGTRQTGVMQLRVADIVRDQPLLNKVSTAAQIIQEKYPTHIQPLINRWIGHAAAYGEV